MNPKLSDISLPSRLAAEGEGIGMEELALAARNHGLPLEALRHDVTPPGLHYLLTHYDIPHVDPGMWSLRVGGLVGTPLALTLDELKAMPSRTVRVTMECAGNGRAALVPRPVSQPWLVEAVGTAEWTGVPLRDVLERAKPGEDGVDVVFTGADHGIERGVEQDYRRGLPLAETRGEDVLLAYAMNGADLPPQHGFPLRLIVPGWYGMASVKWLCDLEVTGSAFTGFQNAVAYRVRHGEDEDGEPVSWMAPRALLIPPGFPDFLSRHRIVRPGTVELAGRAWSGRAPVSEVEVSADGGEHWWSATLAAETGHRWAWRRWTTTWEARPGQHELSVRAVDGSGNGQPARQAWNRRGFANNAVHRVRVTCLADQG
ncbi:sulfite oxidase [Prauserella marina]|nr:sulfite oxidase [Prauserella marina]ASR34822.1 sulfite oxidase [Prauserella marina]